MSAARLATRLSSQYDITALVRSARGAEELRGAGHSNGGHRPRSGPACRCRSPKGSIRKRSSISPRRRTAAKAICAWIAFCSSPPSRRARFVYMSTTGVYGDMRGEMVDESTPVRPLTERARRRVSAEEMTRVWCNERRVRRVVLRVPGIYGPGRLPLEGCVALSLSCEPRTRASAIASTSTTWSRSAQPP